MRYTAQTGLLRLVLRSVATVLLGIAAAVAPVEADDDATAEADRRWFAFAAMVNSHPRLESEKLIQRYFNPTVRAIAPNFRDVRTVGDLRDEYLLWIPHVGVGRVLSDRWSVFVQGGYSAGTVRTKSRNVSLFLFPLHTDFEIQRGAFYMGAGLDYYPWGQVEQRDYRGLGDRLRHAKPSLGLRHTWTYADYKAKAKLRFAPFDNIVSYSERDAWLVPSYGVFAGLDVPVNKRNVLIVNGGYNLFSRRRADFEGAAATLGWKYLF